MLVVGTARKATQRRNACGWGEQGQPGGGRGPEPAQDKSHGNGAEEFGSDGTFGLGGWRTHRHDPLGTDDVG